MKKIDPKRITNIVLGAILVACGVIYFLDAFEIADVNFSLDGWWTLFIILPCLKGLFTSKEKLGNLIGLAAGIFLLLAARGVIEYEMIWKIAGPALIVLIGIRLILKKNNYDDDNKDDEDDGDNDDNRDDYDE